MAQQRRWVCVVVAVLGLLGAFYVQKDGLTLQTAPTFVAGLLALLAAGEITVRILDRGSHRERHAAAGGSADHPVSALLEGLPGRGVVLHDVHTPRGSIEHLVFRPEGVVFLIETCPEPGSVAEEGGELRLNGRLLPKHLFKKIRRQQDWLRGFLQEQLGCDVRLEAGIVFSNAEVAAAYHCDGVDLLGLGHLEPWLDTAQPNDEFGKRLWPQMGQLKTQLLALSERPSLWAQAVAPGVVMLLGVVWLWLAINAPSAAKQPGTPAIQLAHPVQKVAELISALRKPQSAPAWMKEVHLQGLSGAPPDRLAIINGKTFALGESGPIKLAGREVMIRCVDILGESALISAEGVAGTTELRLRDGAREPAGRPAPAR